MPFRRSTSQCEPGRRKTSWYSSSHTDLCRTYNFNIISFHLLIFEPWNHGRIRIRTWRINNSRFLLWSAAEVARVYSSACQGPPACLSPCNFPGSLSKFCKQAKLTPRKRHRFLQETVWASKRRKEKNRCLFLTGVLVSFSMSRKTNTICQQSTHKRMYLQEQEKLK